MKVLLAGAFGNLGFEILKALTEKKYEVVAADLKEKENNGQFFLAIPLYFLKLKC